MPQIQPRIGFLNCLFQTYLAQVYVLLCTSIPCLSSFCLDWLMASAIQLPDSRKDRRATHSLYIISLVAGSCQRRGAGLGQDSCTAVQHGAQGAALVAPQIATEKYPIEQRLRRVWLYFGWHGLHWDWVSGRLDTHQMPILTGRSGVWPKAGHSPLTRWPVNTGTFGTWPEASPNSIKCTP